MQSPEGRELFGLREADRSERREWLFNLFPSLKVRQTQMAATLSGGERQMLTIARALMMKPDLLMPLGLAPLIMEQISKALERLRRAAEITVLLGEQTINFALPTPTACTCSNAAGSFGRRTRSVRKGSRGATSIAPGFAAASSTRWASRMR
jgi:ABC-type taurine transport system ATPase subunit